MAQCLIEMQCCWDNILERMELVQWLLYSCHFWDDKYDLVRIIEVLFGKSNAFLGVIQISLEWEAKCRFQIYVQFIPIRAAQYPKEITVEFMP